MRPVLVEAGDVGIYGENVKPFVLRPSLRNISTLGTLPRLWRCSRV